MNSSQSGFLTAWGELHHGVDANILHRVFHLGNVRLGNASAVASSRWLRSASVRKRRKLRAKISRSTWLSKRC